MSEEDLNKATDVLLSYLKDRDNTLDVEANINGVNRQVFNQRESDHMIDVRNLYLGAMAIRNISIVITVISLIVLIIRKGINHLYNGFLKALGLYGLFFLVLGTFALIDFNSFWTAFHHVFFPMNDLWLLDPRTDILIMMVPEKFFFDLVFSIIITIISILLITWIVLKELDKRIFNHA